MLSVPWAAITSRSLIADGRDAEVMDNDGGCGSVHVGVPGSTG